MKRIPLRAFSHITMPPERYDNSVNLFKIVNMILTLKNAIGVDYDQDIMQNSDFHDSRDFFLHGCLNGEMKGGCISIPTLCVTVGRRLGVSAQVGINTGARVFSLG